MTSLIFFLSLFRCDFFLRLLMLVSEGMRYACVRV